MSGRPENYDDFLRSPEWRQVRDEVIAEAQGQCEYCDRDATEVHHFTYIHLTSKGFLVAVCRTCHEELEGDRRDDPEAHLTSAPAVRRWLVRRYGKEWWKLNETVLGRAWLASQREMQDIRDNECRLCGRAIPSRFELCYRCAQDQGAI